MCPPHSLTVCSSGNVHQACISMQALHLWGPTAPQARYWKAWLGGRHLASSGQTVTSFCVNKICSCGLGVCALQAKQMACPFAHTCAPTSVVLNNGFLAAHQAAHIAGQVWISATLHGAACRASWRPLANTEVYVDMDPQQFNSEVRRRALEWRGEQEAAFHRKVRESSHHAARAGVYI